MVNGKCLLDLCKSTGLRLLNGRTDCDKMGKLTCINPQGSSVSDLVLCKTDMFEYINDFKVQDANILSDHCLVSFTIKAGKVFKSDFNKRHCNRKMNCNEKLSQVYKWDDGKKDQFLTSLNSEEICHKMKKLSEAFDFVVKDIIWYKLIKIGVRGDILNIIKSMYENLKLHVE